MKHEKTYITYKHYILKNKIADSKEAYADYNEQYGEIYKNLSDTQKKQFVERNYFMRFIESPVM